MKRSLLNKLGDFVLGKGFYIVLFLCVATIGISGYYLMNSFTPGVERPAAGTPEVVLPDESGETQKNTPPTAQAKPKTAEDKPADENKANKPQTPAPVQQPAPVASAAPTVYSWPVEGEILRDFSVETLAYDETMGDWRTHSGIDIAADAGCDVLCMGDGVVKSVFEHDLMGVTVVVDHQNGMVSTYANLEAEPLAAAGQEVERGTVLGRVGATALAESALPAHLHLEVSRDGTPANPADVLPAS